MGWRTKFLPPNTPLRVLLYKKHVLSGKAEYNVPTLHLSHSTNLRFGVFPTDTLTSGLEDLGLSTTPAVSGQPDLPPESQSPKNRSNIGLMRCGEPDQANHRN